MPDAAAPRYKQGMPASRKPLVRHLPLPGARRAWSTVATIIALVGSTSLGGCAHVFVDADGRQHVLGLVAMTLPAPPSESAGADGLRVRSMGLSLTQDLSGPTLVLGYSDVTLMRLHNHSLVLAPPSVP